MKNQGRLRLVAWNIEKGKRWPLLEKCLEHEAIRTADVLCLNEVDDGMARSGNRRIAYEIGERLGMQVVFGQTFKEFTKGVGDELLAPGENTTAVQGNATLSRLPILDSLNLALPVCHDPSRSVEKRRGGRHALVVRVDFAGAPLTIANAHLEVFTTMKRRARQMKFLLDRLSPGPAIVTGDFNTNTFERGSFLRTCQSLFNLVRPSVKSRIQTPWLYESLFHELMSAGFSWQPFNDTIPTCTADLSSLEDSKYIPAAIRDVILTHCRILNLRLDFITCRGLSPLSPGRTVTDLPCQPSDHLPITCDVRLREQRA